MSYPFTSARPKGLVTDLDFVLGITEGLLVGRDQCEVCLCNRCTNFDGCIRCPHIGPNKCKPVNGNERVIVECALFKGRR